MLSIAQPVVFVDTETTHLNPCVARPWEIALIRRHPDEGVEQSLHLMVAGVDLGSADPEALAVGHFAERYGPGAPCLWAPPVLAAATVDWMTRPGPGGAPAALVGSCPSYDATVLARFLRAHDREPRWDHHTHDLVTWSYAALGSSLVEAAVMRTGSYDLSRALGVEPPGPAEQHTAMGDAQWCVRWWDALMTGVSA